MKAVDCPLKRVNSRKRETNANQEGWTPVGYLWVRTIPCQSPTCTAEIPLVKQFWLCKKDDKKIAYRPIVDRKNETVDFEILQGEKLQKNIEQGFDPKDGTVSQANASCPVCGHVTEADQTRKLGRDGKMDERLAVVILHHPNETGKKYRLAEESDVSIFEEAESYLKEKKRNWKDVESPLPDEKISTYEPSRVAPPLYGISKWKEIFNSRQKISLITLINKIKSSKNKIENEVKNILENSELEGEKDKVVKAVIGYLGILISRTADYNSSLCGWENTREGIDHTFGRQAIPMKWDYCETNVFSRSSGDWSSHSDWVLRFIRKNDWHPPAESNANQNSATNLSFEDNSVDAVITDPPYYDNVPYAALSDFFYVWLKRSVGDVLPNLFSTPLVPIFDTPLTGAERRKV